MTNEGLVLGRSVLAKIKSGPVLSPEFVLDGQEERILALLAVVYGETIGPPVLAAMRRASSYWKSGCRQGHGDDCGKTGCEEVIGGVRAAAIPSAAILALGFCAMVHASAATSHRYCLTIAAGLRPELREEVSVIDLVIENGSVVAIPRFPAGWGLKVQNYSDNTPTTIFGGATGSAAELRAEDLKCLFEIENGVPGTPPIRVSGNIAISTGEHERRVVLGKNQIILEKINSSR